MAEEKEMQEKVQQLSVYEQNLQQLLMQKQQLMTQVMEFDSALDELKDTDEAYKIIGNIMVASKKDELEKNLKEKKEVVDLRMTKIEKQEEQLKKQKEELQKQVLSGMK